MNSGVPVTKQDCKMFSFCLVYKVSLSKNLRTGSEINHITDDTPSSRLLHDNCQSKISNLNQSTISIDKNIIAFQVPMNNRRTVTVQKAQAAENLTRPVLDGFHIHILMLIPVPAHEGSTFLVKQKSLTPICFRVKTSILAPSR